MEYLEVRSLSTQTVYLLKLSYLILERKLYYYCLYPL